MRKLRLALRGLRRKTVLISFPITWRRRTRVRSNNVIRRVVSGTVSPVPLIKLVVFLILKLLPLKRPIVRILMVDHRPRETWV